MTEKVGNTIKRNLWLILLLAAAVLIAVSGIANRGTDITESVAHRVQRIVNVRMDILDRYIEEAVTQYHHQWLDLEGLPEDMVLYRYTRDTLQSWYNQFTVDNDDISNRMVFQRFLNLRNNLVSPLAQVDTSVNYMNIGPKWYLTKAAIAPDGCKVIAGLEIKNTMLTSPVNGINRKLRVSDRFSIYPISYSGGATISVDGRPLMKIIQENAKVSPLMPDPIALWIALLLIISGALLYLHYHKSLRSMWAVAGSLTILLMVFYVIGRGLQSTNMFSPTIYADGQAFYSLGALLTFNIWITLMVFCAYISRKPLIAWTARKEGTGRLTVFTVIVALAFVGICTYTHLTFSSLIKNSNITLELYKIYGISQYTVYVYISYLAMLLTLPMLIQMACPMVQKMTGRKFNIFSRKGRAAFSVLAAVYLVATSSVTGFNREKNRVDIWANRMAIDRDLGFEIQLRGVENPIANDPLIYRLMTGQRDYQDIILNRITENYMNRIAQNYDITIYTFREGEADPEAIRQFREVMENGIQISDDSHFMYMRKANGRPQYTGYFSFFSPQTGVSQMMIGVESKADKEDRGYASILGNPNPGSIAIPQLYSYAKYIDGKLVSFRGDYAYPTTLSGQLKEAVESSEKYSNIDKYVHFISHISDEDMVIISRPGEDFSQFLVAGFILLLLAYFISCLVSASQQKRSAFDKNYYRSRINSILYISLIVTLVVMAIISVVFVYNRNEANIRALMINKIGTIQSLMEAECGSYSNLSDFDNQSSSAVIRSIGDYTKSDITLYTTGGKAFLSTSPEVFERMILGSRTNQEAYKNIMQRNKRYFIHKERSGDKSFYAMYAPIFNRNGRMLAILCSPYTNSGIDFRTEATFHSLFIITVFFLLLIITRFATSSMIDRMLHPLLTMGEKMNSARTQGLEYIIYEREDELSTLVRAYNLMVHDLSESSKIAAQAERDKAWSEMARQVAHEIKNPLTPIKLQIQRIIRLKSKNDPTWEEKFDQMTPLILDSIDNLTDTANEFSTFAKLYSEEPVDIDIDKMIKDEVALFGDRDNLSIEYIGLKDTKINGPKPQLKRVIVNLLTNAVQAIDNQQKEDAESGKASKKGQVQVSLRNSSRDGFIDIVFEDNGPGVNDENRGRLFTPNFTTKSSGTGLGLAMCKNILERCGAEISYSKSFTLGGACFTVRFPKISTTEGA